MPPMRTCWPRSSDWIGPITGRWLATARRWRAQAGGPGHQSLIWDRTGHLQRLRAALREYFLAAVDAFAAAKIELGDPDALELLAGRRIHGQRPGCPGRSLPR
jgi:hypothetical protein